LSFSAIAITIERGLKLKLGVVLSFEFASDSLNDSENRTGATVLAYDELMKKIKEKKVEVKTKLKAIICLSFPIKPLISDCSFAAETS
jgi:hypothetical protein